MSLRTLRRLIVLLVFSVVFAQSPLPYATPTAEAASLSSMFQNLSSLFGVEKVTSAWQKVFGSVPASTQVGQVAQVVGGAPSISSVSGSFTHNSTVTIHGANFGVKSPAKPLLWAPFEGSAQPSNLGVITSWATIEYMAFYSGEGYGGTGGLGSTATPYEGHWTASIDSTGFAWNDASHKMYLFRRIKRNFDIDPAINWKIIRFWAFDPATGYQNYPNWHIGTYNCRLFVEGISSGSWLNDNYYTPNACERTRGSANVWRTEEFEEQANSAPTLSDGIFKYWVDSTLIESLPRPGSDPSGVNNRWKTRGTTTNQIFNITRAYPVHGMYANYQPPSNYRYWVDDVYMDTTWARVMLGNQPTFTASTEREMQIPSAWSDDTISIVVNQGEFSSGQTAYLYVIDANGNVNTAGYPITIGSSGSNPTPSDTTPPTVSLLAPASGATVSGNTTLSATASDNTVNIFDYNLLLTNFGTTGSCGIAGDANGDCAVNIFDYNILLGEFGMSG